MNFDSSTLDPGFSTFPTIRVATHRLADYDSIISMNSDYTILKNSNQMFDFDANMDGTRNLMRGFSTIPGSAIIMGGSSSVAAIQDDSSNPFFGAATTNVNDSSVVSSKEPEFDTLYRHSVTMTAVYCVAYILVFIVGLIGNSFVIAVVLRAPRMRTVTNFFIANLAVADILVIVFCLPATLMSNIFVPWMLGWLMCKTVPYIQGVSVAASVYSLIAVSLDRHHILKRIRTISSDPLKQKNATKTLGKIGSKIALACIFAVAFAAPGGVVVAPVAHAVPVAHVAAPVEVSHQSTFLAIWYPLKQMTKRRARIMIMCIWIIALGATIPWALFFDLVTNHPTAPGIVVCVEIWPPGTDGNLYFLLANLVACYLLPMALITLCYVLIWIKVWTRSIPGDSKDAQMDRMQQKSKVKVVKMLVAVVILFVLSWLPLYVIFARIKFGGERSMQEEEILSIAAPIAQWLGSSNSCINPILYAFFNKKYRRGFGAIIKSRTCCGRLRYYDNVAIASSSTSTRKSSHYQNSAKKGACSSPSIKSDAVSYIYENNNNNSSRHHRHHHVVAKQDSNLSRQMLLKQDSNVSRQSLIRNQDYHGSRQLLIKQESCGGNSCVSRQDSNASRQMLLKQDSNGSRNSLAKQDSQISYIETKRGQLMRQDSDLSKRDSYSTTDSVSIDSRRGILCKQDTQISYIENVHPSSNRKTNNNCLASQDSIVSFIEHKRYKLVKQDSVISFADQRPESRRHQLVKQDSVISFADQKRSCLTKQDSVIAYPNRNGEGHHVSILKKTDSQSSNSPRKNIEFAE